MSAQCPWTGPEIDDETAIWRYMDLPKFVWLLANRQLRFATASTLRDDPWEGYGQATHRADPPAGDGAAVITCEDERGTRKMSIDQMTAEISRMVAEDCRNARDQLYINSWCLGQESMAMWKIYGSEGKGVAVKSSIGRYVRGLRFDVPTVQYRFGQVVYHADLRTAAEIRQDFSSGAIPQSSNLWSKILQQGLHKRSCFHYEQEWRALIYQNAPERGDGVGVSFDLDELISTIYVGPCAEDFLVETVAVIVDKFGLKKPLEKSMLLQAP